MGLKINWMWVARVLKVGALLGFLLPWVVVSCGDQLMMSASGLDLVRGTPQVADTKVPPDMLGSAWWATAAAVVIVIALVAGIVIRAQRLRAWGTVCASVAAILLLGCGMMQSIDKLQSKVEENLSGRGDGQGEAEVAQVLAGFFGGREIITIDVKGGFWLVLGLLGGAAVAGVGAAVSRKPVPVDDRGEAV